MAATWSPAWDQDDQVTPRVVAAQVNETMLDPWFLQTVLPVTSTPLTAWLFDQTGYVPPSAPGTGPPSPTSGRGYPPASSR